MVILKSCHLCRKAIRPLTVPLASARTYAEDAVSSLEAISDDVLRSALTDAAYYTVARTL